MNYLQDEYSFFPHNIRREHPGIYQKGNLKEWRSTFPIHFKCIEYTGFKWVENWVSLITCMGTKHENSDESPSSAQVVLKP